MRGKTRVTPGVRVVPGCKAPPTRSMKSTTLHEAGCADMQTLLKTYDVTVQTQDNANTLKLCGRAFVRALVYTCGGSRWRRLMSEEDILPDGNKQLNVLKKTEMPTIDRHWRDQNQALIAACCQTGCRRSDLFMLC
ncbi:relaxin-3-like [Betta splendens]|uniref:Relaxin-3-like n=1 Tax=Betta splendens TaxID=158456 RepID=A0A6P7KZB8_BETSP|nr:relaxin-3-like [Betta splendens]